MPDRKEWKVLPIVTQAAIRCGDPTFLQFLIANIDDPLPLRVLSDKERAARIVRSHCGITSRRELATNDKAAEIFRKLDEDFATWNKW